MHTVTLYMCVCKHVDTYTYKYSDSLIHMQSRSHRTQGHVHTCIPHMHTQRHTRAHPCRRTHAGILRHGIGGPQDHPWFSGLLGSQHVTMLLAKVYYSKMMKSSVSKGKRPGRSPEETRLPRVLCPGLKQGTLNSASTN